ncbi:MAG: molecular chaperone DnaK, partial [Pseudonocardia sp.]
TEKFVKENDEKLPAEIKDGVNAALGEAQEALKGTDSAAIQSAMERLATESQKMGAALYQQPGAEGAGPGPDAGPSGGQQPDDVVDAEIVDEEKDRK